jgi:hypothetical protein
MTLKNNDNTQFARVANADGSSPIGAAAVGDGLAPLCDDQGHLIVSSGGAVINFALSRTSETDGDSPAGAQAPGAYQPALCDAHGRAITSNLTSTAAGQKTGGAAAANTLTPPLVDQHGRAIPVGLIGNPDGSNPGGAGAVNTLQIPLLDNQGRLVVVPYAGGSILSGAPAFVDSAAVTLWHLVSAVPAKLYQAWGAQDSGGLLWLQFFDLAAGPPGGAVVPKSAPIPVDSPGLWSQSFPEGISFGTGIVIAYSTTQSTYTAPVTGGWISALIR